MHGKWKVLTPAGIPAVRQVSLPYVSEYERIDVSYYKTLKQDGAVLDGDQQHVVDVSQPVSPAAPVFSGTRLEEFTFLNVAAGDEVEYQFSKYLKPAKPGDFWAIHRPIQNVVVRSETVTLDVPADRKVAFHASAAEHSFEQNGRRIQTWHLINSRPRSKDLQPPAVFAISTMLSWDAVGVWLRTLNQQSEQSAPSVQELATRLTAGKPSVKAKIDALYQYVSTNIRYVSISFGLGRLQPHGAEDVLRTGYGDCKDKNALFSALLQAIGSSPRAVLTSPGVWET